MAATAHAMRSCGHDIFFFGQSVNAYIQEAAYDNAVQEYKHIKCNCRKHGESFLNGYKGRCMCVWATGICYALVDYTRCKNKSLDQTHIHLDVLKFRWEA